MEWDELHRSEDVQQLMAQARYSKAVPRTALRAKRSTSVSPRSPTGSALSMSR